MKLRGSSGSANEMDTPASGSRDIREAGPSCEEEGGPGGTFPTKSRAARGCPPDPSGADGWPSAFAAPALSVVSTRARGKSRGVRAGHWKPSSYPSRGLAGRGLASRPRRSPTSAAPAVDLSPPGTRSLRRRDHPPHAGSRSQRSRRPISQPPVTDLSTTGGQSRGFWNPIS